MQYSFNISSMSLQSYCSSSLILIHYLLLKVLYQCGSSSSVWCRTFIQVAPTQHSSKYLLHITWAFIFSGSSSTCHTYPSPYRECFVIDLYSSEEVLLSCKQLWREQMGVFLFRVAFFSKTGAVYTVCSGSIITRKKKEKVDLIKNTFFSQMF